MNKKLNNKNIKTDSEVGLKNSVSVCKVLILTTENNYSIIFEGMYDDVINRLYAESDKLEASGILKVDEEWNLREDYKGYITFDFATKEGGYACSLVVCDGVASNIQLI